MDLLKLAFCRTMIEQANVSFGHQSMSFKNGDRGSHMKAIWSPEELVALNWAHAVKSIARAAETMIHAEPSISAAVTL